MEHFSLAAIPAELNDSLRRALGDQGVPEQFGASLSELDPGLQSTIPAVFACSEFVVRQACRNPEWLSKPEFAARIAQPTTLSEYCDRVRTAIQGATTDDSLMRAVRQLRNREMLRIAWRDLTGLATLDETLAETSLLAEALVRETLHYLFVRMGERTSLPCSADGQPQSLLVLAMGKLGAWELNFSSDIDLIFAYRAEGTLPDRKGTSFNEFYTRLAQKLIHTLASVTEDGFVFRVDMRLRPFGDSGPLVLNLDATERYYQTQAREWERYAMVKARAIAGDADLVSDVEAILRPFVYRRYLDYRAFGELRELKEKIAFEMVRQDRLDNVKLGPGGIREIEFIAQAFQLIRGGCEPVLQDRRLLTVLRLLGERGHLPEPVAAKLASAYRFLRLVENRLQQFADQQTHDLPTDPLRRTILAFGTGFADWASFRSRIDEVRRQVHEVFEQVMAAPQAETQDIGLLDLDGTPVFEALKTLGFRDPGRVQSMLAEFRSSHSIRRLSVRGNAELKRLLPLLLRAVAASGSPEAVLERILGLLQAIASRNVYFTLLSENPLAVSQLVKLSTASPWIVHHITRFPILLDELLDPRTLYGPMTRVQLDRQLSETVRAIDPADGERLMNALGQFKQAQVLRVAATDIMGITPVMVVSDRLTYVAEAIVTATLAQSWQSTAVRQGTSQLTPEGTRTPGFAVIAYGKLGGIELGYGSDLDLVFLHVESNTGVEFFSRVAKRMINLLTTQGHSGKLYEIDLRLRPSGSSGLLVSSLEAYERYQLEAAWTWEQQALIRARFIAGDPAVGRRFDDIRRQSLARRRDVDTLRQEIRDMRERMRAELAVKDPGVFDLKQGVGGVADIEFIVQFEVLAHAADDPGLLRWTDIVRQLESLSESGSLSRDDAAQLRDAYCHYRELTHRCALQETPAVIPADAERPRREAIAGIWQRIMDDRCEARV